MSSSPQPQFDLLSSLPASGEVGSIEAVNDYGGDYVMVMTGIPLDTEQLPLSVSDERLLQHLGAQEIDTTWLERANQAMQLGSRHISNKHPADVTAATVAARRTFYGELLHLRPETYAKLLTKFPNLLPINTFMGTARILFGLHIPIANQLHRINYGSENARKKINYQAKVGLNPQALLRGDITLLGSSVGAVDRAIEDIEAEGFSRLILNKSPQLIGYSRAARLTALRDMREVHKAEVVDRVVRVFPRRMVSDRSNENARIQALQTVVAAAGWSFNALDLVEQQPTIASLAPLTSLARLCVIGTFTNEETKISCVARLMTVPTEDVLVALSEGVESFTAKGIARAVQAVSKGDRLERARMLLEDPLFISQLGERTQYLLRKHYGLVSEEEELAYGNSLPGGL